ncbi:MAG: hypothetical protein KAT34_06070 [Candidatus Aminicenantes bacterium]|nr:hypothetical protein [Candidatus Aminicenantes bacterium]
MKKFLLVLTFLFAASPIFSAKLAVLPEVLKPNGLIVDGDRLFITAKTATVYLYSTKNFKFIKQFLKSGEGPGESRNPLLSLKVYPGFLAIEDVPKKIMFFTRDGDYKKEKRLPQNYNDISCIGKNFCACITHIDSKKGTKYSTVNLLDKNFNVIKMLHKGEELALFISGSGDSKKIIRSVQNYLIYQVYEDRIYVFDTQNGFSIIVFDSSGNRLYVIDKDYKKIKIPESYIDNFMNRMKKTPTWERLKIAFHFDFPECFPAIIASSSNVNSKKIYALTFETKAGNGDKKDQRELVVLDLKGKILQRTFVPVCKECYMYKDKFYYLLENEEEEQWELHALDI